MFRYTHELLSSFCEADILPTGFLFQFYILYNLYSLRFFENCYLWD
jgi:hypothetical protein